jgi:hypothetical protein
MSQIRGGRADKFGNRFERLWVVNLSLQVIDGTLTSVKWEPLGDEGDGIECVTTHPDGAKAFHQCKLQNSSKGIWSISALKHRGVLGAAKKRLQSEPRSKFIFVSDDNPRALKDMVQHSQQCDQDPTAFLSTCSQSSHADKHWRELLEGWELDKSNPLHVSLAISMLSRIECHNGFLGHEEDVLLRIAEKSIAGDGRRVVQFLGDQLESRIGNTFHADNLLAMLEINGLPTRDLGINTNLPAAINQCQERFRSALEPHLIDHQFISRPEPHELIEMACKPGEAKLIFVTGEPGAGKSGALLQLTRSLRKNRPNRRVSPTSARWTG